MSQDSGLIIGGPGASAPSLIRSAFGIAEKTIIRISAETEALLNTGRTLSGGPGVPFTDAIVLSIGFEEASRQGFLADLSTEELDRLRHLESGTGGLPARLSTTVDSIASGVSDLVGELGGFLDFILPRSLSLGDLLDTLSELLLKPPRVPGEPCLAPAPLLRDLLDIALGRVTGALGATVGKVADSVLDLLLPAVGVEADLVHAIESILDDPITAALNLVLGKRNQIDCPVKASLGVSTRVIETQEERIEDALEVILV